MSISFLCFAEPEEVVETFDCTCTQGGECEAQSDCWECKGSGKFEMFQRPHELNLSNANAAIIMKAMNIEFDYCGQWSREMLSEVRRKIVKAMNVRATSLLARESKVENGTGGCMVYTMPLDPQGIGRRLRRMLELVTFAQESGYEVNWG